MSIIVIPSKNIYSEKHNKIIDNNISTVERNINDVIVNNGNILSKEYTFNFLNISISEAGDIVAEEIYTDTNNTEGFVFEKNDNPLLPSVKSTVRLKIGEKCRISLETTESGTFISSHRVKSVRTCIVKYPNGSIQQEELVYYPDLPVPIDFYDEENGIIEFSFSHTLRQHMILINDRYYPSLKLSLVGEYITTEEKTNVLGDGKNVIKLETNELVQNTSDKVYEISNNILEKHSNGYETATIKCSISDYYDENGNIVIDTSGKSLTKNLLQINKESSYNYGVEYEIRDGILVLNGTAISSNPSVSFDSVLIGNLILDAGTYYLSGMTRNQYYTTLRVAEENGDTLESANISGSYKFSVGSKTSLNVFIDQKPGYVYNNFVIKPMISKIQNADFEPYKAKMLFHLHDRVIPMLRNFDGTDEPISKYYGLYPKTFEVIGSEVFYDGAVWQKLSLKEVISNYVIKFIAEAGYAGDKPSVALNIQGKGDIYINGELVDTIDSLEEVKAWSYKIDGTVTIEFVGSFTTIATRIKEQSTGASTSWGAINKIISWDYRINYLYPRMFYRQLLRYFEREIPSWIKKIGKEAFLDTVTYDADYIFEIPSHIEEIDELAFSLCDANTFKFLHPVGKFIKLAQAGSGSGVFYSKDAVNKTIYTDNEYIKNYDWVTDNVTPTFYHLDGSAWE